MKKILYVERIYSGNSFHFPLARNLVAKMSSSLLHDWIYAGWINENVSINFGGVWVRLSGFWLRRSCFHPLICRVRPISVLRRVPWAFCNRSVLAGVFCAVFLHTCSLLPGSLFFWYICWALPSVWHCHCPVTEPCQYLLQCWCGKSHSGIPFFPFYQEIP